MEKVNLNRLLFDLELDYVKKALEFTNNNVTNAAELLGVKRSSLSMRLKYLGVVIKRSKRAARTIQEKGNGIKRALLLSGINDIEDQLWNE